MASTHLQLGWRAKTLGEVAEILSGGTPSTKELAYWDGNIPWITPKDLSGFQGVFIDRGERNITEDGYNNSSAKKLQKNTILFSSRAPIGYVAIANNEVTTNQGFKNVFCDEKNSHFRFIYYWLIDKTELIKQLSSGSTFSEASGGLMKSLPILIPSINEQRAIAAVLSSLDDKIQLLRNQNRTLEAIAQRLFNEWFVEFNFPNSEGKPYKKSGGKMVDGELGEIPDGWRVGALEDFVEIVNGYAYKGDELVEKSNQALVTLKNFDRTGGFQARGFKPFIGNPKPKQEVLLGDLVVSHTDLTQNAEVIGNPIVITENGGFEKMFITMDLVKVLPSTDWMDIGFLYFLMRTRNFKEHCKGYSSGTTVLHMSKKAIPEYHLVVPNDHELVKTFSAISKNLLGKLANNSSHIQTLATLRESLLPRMMSGEVRVQNNS